MSKKTSWFPPEVKPMNIGVYETEIVGLYGRGRHGYSHWDGTQFGNTRSTPKMAASEPNYESALQNKRWRGLAAPVERGGDKS